ncbi:MAG: hypothetical protein ACRC8J_00615 [Phocaeicola sp.]
MANTNPEWEKIYKEYLQSGLSRGDFIRKHHLSNYAFDKFKKLDALHNKKDTETANETLFVPVQVELEKEVPVLSAEEVSSLVLSSGNIQIVVTEQTNQRLLLKVLKAVNELC